MDKDNKNEELNNTDRGWSKFREIKYVHELQNLFRSITGVVLGGTFAY